MAARTALVVIDCQNDFAHPDGALAVRDGAAILPRVASLMADIRAGEGFVVATLDWHPANHASFASAHGRPPFTEWHGRMLWPDHCVAGTWGAELAAGIDGGMIDRRLLKGCHPQDESYSGFRDDTPIDGSVELTLEQVLRTAEVRELDVVGLATDYCVRATVLDALSLGFTVRVHADAIRPVDATSGDRALREMAAAGAAIVG